jgi:hypothetical protein
MKKSLLALVVAPLLLGGCAFLEIELPPAPVAAYAPTNYKGEARLPAAIHRVAVLPAYGGDVTDPESAAALDLVLLTALQRQMRFEIVTLSRDECRHMFGAGSFGSTAALPPGILEKIATTYAVDAVLFIDITVYQPYRPLALGFRAKLATVRDVRLVWTFDEVFSAGQAAMLTSVQEYYEGSDKSGPTDISASVLQSPTRFGAVAADLMFKTLPPR